MNYHKRSESKQELKSVRKYKIQNTFVKMLYTKLLLEEYYINKYITTYQRRSVPNINLA